MNDVATAAQDRIYLSPPDIGAAERRYVQEAFDTNWIAPVGPHVDAFERAVADYAGTAHAVATSSGTAAIHLALQLAGVGPGDEVLVSTFTFCASVNPAVYLGATPTFVGSEWRSWNLDPNLLEDVLERRAARRRIPKALVVVDLYGQCADLGPIAELCANYGVTLIEDAAEALGATYEGRSAGSFGKAGVFSFNGNKIITTSGGGMLVTDDAEWARHAKKLATQAREPVVHYEHTEVGYNYRLSNVLAGIGRGQLEKLDDRVAARRRIFGYYRTHLGELPGVSFMPDAGWGRHTRWLTCAVIDPGAFGTDHEAVRLALEAENVEARPLWKPMHLQPVFEDCEVVGGSVSEALFARGLCLPSGSALTDAQLERIVTIVRDCAGCTPPHVSS